MSLIRIIPKAAATLLISVTLVVSAAQASSGPIKIGWLVGLTGPNSTPGIGFNRGVQYAAKEINKNGGIDGRKVEVITRDTQGDPTKAVNAALELINSKHVQFMIGPTNSGAGLASTPVIARYNVTSFVYGVVNRLINSKKYPNAYRILPSNTQWTEGANRYVRKVLNVKDVAVIGDSTGYGTTTSQLDVKELRKNGEKVTYKALINPNETDVSSNIQKAKASGAKAVLVWSDSAGVIARLLNARAEANWDVPFVGHPAMGSGSVKALLSKPENWKKVDIIGYKSTSYNASGQLPPRTQKFLKNARQAGVKLNDTTLWWVAAGYDTVELIKYAVEHAHSTDAKAIRKVLEHMKPYSGVYGDYRYSATNHNGYPTNEIVMNRADSFKDGAYALAPGYK